MLSSSSVSVPFTNADISGARGGACRAGTSAKDAESCSHAIVLFESHSSSPVSRPAVDLPETLILDLFHVINASETQISSP